jgi:hypothetical protein
MSNTTVFHFTCFFCEQEITRQDTKVGPRWANALGETACDNELGIHVSLDENGMNCGYNEDSDHECDSECDISALSDSLRKVTTQLQEATEVIIELRAEKQRAEIARLARNARRWQIASIAVSIGFGLLRGWLRASIAAAEQNEAV